MARDRFNVPVAELFAVLGLDASNLDEGLANSTVNIKNFQAEINSVAAQVTTSFKQVEPAVLALNAALNQLPTDAANATSSIKNLDASTNKLVATQERFEAQSVRMKAAYAQAQAEMQAAEEARFERYMTEDEEMSRADGQRLARAEEISRAIVAATKAETLAVEEYVASIQSSLPFLSGYGAESGGGGRGGGGGYGNIGFRMGTGGINPYFRITESIAATLGPLMDLIFPIALLTLGIDLWSRFQGSIQNVVNSLTGAINVFDQLTTATDKMYTAEQKDIDRQEHIRTAAHRLGITPQALETQIGQISTPGTIRLDKLIEEQRRYKTVYDAIAAQLKNVPPGGRDLYVEAAAKVYPGVPGLQDLTSVTLPKEQEKTNERIIALTQQKVKIQTEEAESLDRATKATKKWHDEIHELPNKLPFYLSAGHTGYGAALGAAAPQAGVQVMTRRAPSMSEFLGPRATPTARPSIPQAPAGPGASIVIQNTYSPSFNFDGVPADIQNFVRDELEPMIITDLQKNSRGFTADMVKALQAAGIRATN